MSAIEEIAAERQRQVEAEGWTPEHDDTHCDGSLALAAALYATPRPLFDVQKGANGIQWRDPWPWHTEHIYSRYGDGDPAYYLPDGDKRKKHDRRRQLVISAALIVAEIERLDRQQP